MRMFLIWFLAILITLIMISPFFWLWFVKKRNKWLYIILSSVIFLITYYFYIFEGSDLILDVFAKISADAYYFYYDAESTSIPLVPFLMVISPFIFTKIFYGKITVKSFFISVLISIIIFISLFLFFAYYLFPKAGEMLLNNI